MATDFERYMMQVDRLALLASRFRSMIAELAQMVRELDETGRATMRALQPDERVEVGLARQCGKTTAALPYVEPYRGAEHGVEEVNDVPRPPLFDMLTRQIEAKKRAEALQMEHEARGEGGVPVRYGGDPAEAKDDSDRDPIPGTYGALRREDNPVWKEFPTLDPRGAGEPLPTITAAMARDKLVDIPYHHDPGAKWHGLERHPITEDERHKLTAAEKDWLTNRAIERGHEPAKFPKDLDVIARDDYRPAPKSSLKPVTCQCQHHYGHREHSRECPFQEGDSCPMK